MRCVCYDVVFFKVCHNVAVDFTWNRCKGNGTIAFWQVFISFFEDSRHICSAPV